MVDARRDASDARRVGLRRAVGEDEEEDEEDEEDEDDEDDDADDDDAAFV